MDSVHRCTRLRLRGSTVVRYTFCRLHHTRRLLLLHTAVVTATGSVTGSRRDTAFTPHTTPFTATFTGYFAHCTLVHLRLPLLRYPYICLPAAPLRLLLYGSGSGSYFCAVTRGWLPAVAHVHTVFTCGSRFVYRLRTFGYATLRWLPFTLVRGLLPHTPHVAVRVRLPTRLPYARFIYTTTLPPLPLV